VTACVTHDDQHVDKRVDVKKVSREFITSLALDHFEFESERRLDAAEKLEIERRERERERKPSKEKQKSREGDCSSRACIPFTILCYIPNFEILTADMPPLLRGESRGVAKVGYKYTASSRNERHTIAMIREG